MNIIQHKDNFKAADDVQLELEITEKYTFKGIKPQIKIEGNLVNIHIDDAVFKETQHDFNNAVTLCNGGHYKEAIPLLKDVIKKCPLHSDAFRTLSQVYMLLGDNSKAIDYNIESLRIDAGNEWSLILMGNLLYKENNIEGAMDYYKKVLVYHPDDAMALNNIGGVMLQLKKIDDAITYFSKAKVADPTYMNTYYGLALAYRTKGQLVNAWDTAYEGMTKAVNRAENPKTLAALNSIYFDIAKSLEEKTNSERIIADLIKDVEEKYHEHVLIEKESNMQVCAKLRYNKSSGLKDHVVKYDEKKNHHTHLIVHEFMHLYLMLEASRSGKNIFVITNEDNEAAYNRRYSQFFENIKVRLGSEATEKYRKNLFQSFVLLLMNGPLDLFVEERMFREYNEMRPLQMLSLSEMQMYDLKGMEEAEKNPGNFPNDIVIATRMLNLVSAIQLRNLYGIDYTSHYKPSAEELKKAERFYEEFIHVYDDAEENDSAGNEYDYMLKVISELGFSDIVRTVNEKDYYSKTDTTDSSNTNAEFAKEHKDTSDSKETLFMSLYMLGAMEYFEGMSSDQVRKIAIDIAMLGMGGINPANKSGYKVASMPGKDFGGYEMLAYYYVSWAIALPDKLEALKLPFSKAYEQAVKLYNVRKNK